MFIPDVAVVTTNYGGNIKFYLCFCKIKINLQEWIQRILEMVKKLLIHLRAVAVPAVEEAVFQAGVIIPKSHQKHHQGHPHLQDQMDPVHQLIPLGHHLQSLPGLIPQIT